MHEDLLLDVYEVADAGAQILVLDLLESLAQLGHRLGEGALCRPVAGTDARDGAVLHLHIVEHGQLRVEDHRQIGALLVFDALPCTPHIFTHLREGYMKALDLGLDAIVRYAPQGNGWPFRPVGEDFADSDTWRRGDA